MLLCKSDELVNIRDNCINLSLYRRNSIALPLEPDSTSHHGAEVLEGSPGRSVSIKAPKVRPENESTSGRSSVIISGVKAERSILV